MDSGNWKVDRQTAFLECFEAGASRIKLAPGTFGE